MSKEIEAWGTGEVTCPYCNYEFSDSWEFGSLQRDGDSEVMECDECEKKFNVNFNVETSYTSRGLCDENKNKHNWEYFDHVTDGERNYGRKCLTCDKYEFNVEEKFAKSREGVE